MKSLVISIFALTLSAGVALAQEDLSKQLPEGAMKPTNLNALGSQMKDRMTDIVLGDGDPMPRGLVEDLHRPRERLGVADLTTSLGPGHPGPGRTKGRWRAEAEGTAPALQPDGRGSRAA